MCASRTLHIFRDPVGSSLSVCHNDAASVDDAAPVDERLALGLLVLGAVERGEPEMGRAGQVIGQREDRRPLRELQSCWAEAGAAACGLSLGALET